MESEAPFESLTTRRQRRLVAYAALRASGTVALLLTLYFVLPMDRVDITALAVVGGGCAVLVLGVGWQVRRITTSEYPTVRAAEALAFTIPIFVVLFSTAYFLVSQASATNFTEPLTRTDALYFSVTTFTTTGFGDIAAKSESARLIVTFQMLLDLLLLGLVVRLFLRAVKLGNERRFAQQRDGVGAP